jgi:hypothetical protein
MTSLRIARRRIRRGASRCQSWPLTPPEILGARTLLAGTVPSGTYVEDFALNSDPTKPGWDVRGAFRTEITNSDGVKDIITDPNRVEEVHASHSLGINRSDNTDQQAPRRPP